MFLLPVAQYFFLILLQTCLCLSLLQELPGEEALTPTNFQQFMKHQAQETRRLNEEVEKFKALLKSRKEL